MQKTKSKISNFPHIKLVVMFFVLVVIIVIGVLIVDRKHAKVTGTVVYQPPKVVHSSERINGKVVSN